MRIIEGVTEMTAFAEDARAKGLKIAFVPTMGFLHDGHKELLKIGRKLGDILILSIFVNPAQFGPKEDFKTYPRDLEKDSKIAEGCGVDCIFAPKAEEIYPEGFQTYVEVTGASKNLCGAARPGHFKGVATVVLKLFNIVLPHKAVFGKKDYQQFIIIKRLAEDLNLGVEIVGAETVREPDGLAMSSRNSYLSQGQRKAARCIPEGLNEAKKEFLKGERESRAIIDKVKKIIEKERSAVIEYVKVCDKGSLTDLERIEESALLAVAVRIGKTRLIDNCILSK